MVDSKVAPERPVNRVEFGLEEERIGLGPFLQKLVAEFDTLVYESALKEKNLYKNLEVKLELKRTKK